MGNETCRGSDTLFSLNFSLDFQKLPSFCRNIVYKRGKDYIFKLKHSEITPPQLVSWNNC